MVNLLIILICCFLFTYPSWAVEVKKKPQPGTSPIILKPPKRQTSISDFIISVAWEYYKKGEFFKALRLFNRALSFPESKKEAIKGITYCYIKLGKYRKALEYSDFLPEREREKIRLLIFYKLKNELPFKKILSLIDKELANSKASKKYKLQLKKLKLYVLKEALTNLSPDSPEVPKITQEILSINPDDKGTLEILGWWYYKKGKYSKSSEIFRKLYHKYPQNEKYQEALVRSLLKEGKVDEALKLLEKNTDKLNLLIYQKTHSCFTGINKPWLDSFFQFMHKSGAKGFSELNELIYPFSLTIPFRNNFLSFSFIAKKLYSGHLSSPLYAGSYYKQVPERNKWKTSLWVEFPNIFVDGHFRSFDYSLSISTTPWGGPVSPAFLFSFAFKKDIWSFELYKKPVEESILSYVGQKDPYSDKKWGRVIKKGIKGSFSLSLPKDFWFSLELKYNNFDGLNIWHNSSFVFSSSMGKTFPFYKGNLSVGIFDVFKHFKRNSDFFTFGHGGYFSPKKFVMVGSFVTFNRKKCRKYKLNFSTSLGVLYYQTEDAPKYPLYHVRSYGYYSGDNFLGLGYDIKLNMENFFAKNFLLGFNFEYSKTTNYKKFVFGPSLRYLF